MPRRNQFTDTTFPKLMKLANTDLGFNSYRTWLLKAADTLIHAGRIATEKPEVAEVLLEQVERYIGFMEEEHKGVVEILKIGIDQRRERLTVAKSFAEKDAKRNSPSHDDNTCPTCGDGTGHLAMMPGECPADPSSCPITETVESYFSWVSEADLRRYEREGRA